MPAKELKTKTVKLSELADAAGSSRLISPPQVMSRRGLLRAGGGIILLAALPTGPLLTGCDGVSADDILKAIEMAKDIFNIIEAIGGTIAAINKGDTEQAIRITVDLFEDLSSADGGTTAPGDAGARAGAKADTQTFSAKVPPSRSGEAELITWSGLQARELGSHFAAAAALASSVQSRTFRVEG